MDGHWSSQDNAHVIYGTVQSYKVSGSSASEQDQWDIEIGQRYLIEKKKTLKVCYVSLRNVCGKEATRKWNSRASSLF